MNGCAKSEVLKGLFGVPSGDGVSSRVFLDAAEFLDVVAGVDQGDCRFEVILS